MNAPRGLLAGIMTGLAMKKQNEEAQKIRDQEFEIRKQMFDFQKAQAGVQSQNAKLELQKTMLEMQERERKAQQDAMKQNLLAKIIEGAGLNLGGGQSDQIASQPSMSAPQFSPNFDSMQPPQSGGQQQPSLTGAIGIPGVTAPTVGMRQQGAITGGGGKGILDMLSSGQINPVVAHALKSLDVIDAPGILGDVMKRQAQDETFRHNRQTERTSAANMSISAQNLQLNRLKHADEMKKVDWRKELVDGIEYEVPYNMHGQRLDIEKRTVGKTKDLIDKEKGQKAVSTHLNNLVTAYEKLDDMNAVRNVDKSMGKNIISSIKSSTPGQWIQGAISTDEQSLREVIKTTAPSLINAIRKAEELGVGGMNSEAELEFYKQAISDPAVNDVQSAMAALAILDEMYLGGKVSKRILSGNPSRAKRVEEMREYGKMVSQTGYNVGDVVKGKDANGNEVTSILKGFNSKDGSPIWIKVTQPQQ